MPTSYAATTNATSGYTITHGPPWDSAPTPWPLSQMSIRASQTKAGWVGLVIVDGEVVWESSPRKTAQAAQRRATKHVIRRIKKVLS